MFELPPDQHAIRTALLAGLTLGPLDLTGGCLRGVGLSITFLVPGGAGSISLVTRTSGEVVSRLLTQLSGAGRSSTPSRRGRAAVETVVAHGASAQTVAAYRAEITHDSADREARAPTAALGAGPLQQPEAAQGPLAEASGNAG